MATTVGTKGQVVIEKPIRDALGVRPGYIAVQRLVEDHVEIFFLPPEHTQSLRGVLADVTDVSVPSDAWKQVQEQAWQAAAAEFRGGQETT
ncbi:MAG: AbrB family transcriptional regulator [Caldilineae bacterium]|nr:MAG: AbrB family transcriptional regulator [Caldilineae bacterium]